MKVRIEYSLEKDFYYGCKVEVLSSKLPSNDKVFKVDSDGNRDVITPSDFEEPKFSIKYLYAKKFSDLDYNIQNLLNELKDLEESVNLLIDFLPTDKTVELKNGQWKEIN